MTQEALKLALEALEACTTWNLTREQFDRNVTAIIVIKKALAQPEQEPQRTWVDLTPQDLNDIFKTSNTGEGAVYLALKIIREKNLKEQA